MVAPRKYVHALLIISEAIIISCCLIMIIKYDRTGWKRKIWIGSKILTLNKEIKINNYELYPIIDISSNGNIREYNQNYESLLKHSGPNCEENYKKCGILDTYGNIMCIPSKDECPINDIIVDLNSKKDEYIVKGYKVGELENLLEEYSLYYTNTAIDKEIIVKIKYNYTIPRYINPDNFIFDQDTYESYKSDRSGNGGGYGGGGGGGYGGGGGGGFGGGGGGVGSGGGGFRNLEEEEEETYGDDDITDYIKERFEEDMNIDKSYRNITNNLYVGNYIGFKDYNHMNSFNKMDLYESYFTVFPNLAADVFCYFSIIVFIILIIYSITRFCHKDIPNEGFDPCCVLTAKLFIIIPYLIVFIGYFSYIIYEFLNIYKKRDPEDLIKVRADSFLEDLLQEINDRNVKKDYIVLIIILFSCSMFIFLLAWILSTIFTKRHLKLLKNTY